MFTVTFYSFRGGVGRTMAVANVAAYLADQGLNVFAVDFDLEAPGLSLMSEFLPAGQGMPSPRGGLVDYLRAGLADEPVPSIADLAYEPVLSRELKEKKADAGTIHFLPAGAKPTAAEGYDVAFHLDRLYETRERSVVIDSLKIQIEQTYHPDYLLVDSRTGLTEAGGICTVHLADFVVVVSGLNNQNIEGTVLVLKRLKQFREDFDRNVIFVASPLPVGEEELKKERLQAARRSFADALGIDPEALPPMPSIPYHPRLALSEENFVRHFPDSALSAAYKRLAGQIRLRNAADLRYRFDLARKSLRSNPRRAFEELAPIVASPGAPAAAYMLYVSLLRTFDPQASPEVYYLRAIEAAPTDPYILASYAAFLHVCSRLDEAEDYYKRAIEADLTNADILGNYALFLKNFRNDEDRAEEFYKRAIEADPRHANNLVNYAVFLDDVRKDADRAEEFYKRAIEADPRHANNLGDYARFLQIVRKDADRAEEFYKRAIEADPRHANNLGNYAAFLDDVRKDADRAEEFYKRAIEADPRHANNLGNYAVFLDDVRKDADRAEEFFRRAIEADPKGASTTSAITRYS